MRFASWIRPFTSRGPRATRSARPRRRQGHLGVRLLEDRSLPSTVTWVGPATGGDWSQAAYWSGGVLPGSADDVVIPANVSLTHSTGSDTIHSLSTGSGDNLNITGGSLAVTGTTYNAGALTGSAGTQLSFGGPYSDTGAALIQTAGGVGFGSSAVVSGSYAVSGGTSVGAAVVFTGAVNLTGGTLYVNGGTADFTHASGPTSVADVTVNSGGSLLLGGNLDINGPDGFHDPNGTGQYGFTFTGGTVGGSGTLSLHTDSLLGWSGAANLDVPTLNYGTGTSDGGGPPTPSLQLGAGVTLTNAAGGTLLVGWSAGVGGSGTVDNAAGGTVLAGSPLIRYGPNFTFLVPLTNEGHVQVQNGFLTLAGGSSGSGSYVADAGATLYLQGAQTFLAGSGISGAGTVSFAGPSTVAGSYAVSGGTSIAADVVFTGAVDLTGGTLSVTGTADFTQAAGPASVADVSIDNGGTLLLGGNLDVNGPDIYPFANSAVGFSLYSGTVGGRGTLTLDTDSLLGWQAVNVNAPVVNDRTALVGGSPLTLGAGAALTNAAGATLHLTGGGTIAGAGTLVNLAAGTVLEQPSDSFTVAVPLHNVGLVETAGSLSFNAPASNAGTVLWNGGTIAFAGNGSLTNTTTGTVNDQVDGTIGGSGCPQFTNQGLFLKSGGTGTTVLAMDLFNSGTVEVQQGILDVNCGYVQGAGGSISGTVSGTITNPGTYNSAPSPNPPPVLTSYTQTATGTLSEQIGGLTAGTQYGQIIVNGSVNLAGSLQVALINGFTPHRNDQFIIIDNEGPSPVNGTFAGLPEGAMLTTSSGYAFTISYAGGPNHQSVVLTAAQVPTAISLASDHPTGSVYGQTVTFTATVATSPASALVPTGSVQFQVDGSNYGPPVPLQGGSASIQSDLDAASHTITALYTSSSPQFGNSGPASFTATVSRANQTITWATPAPVIAGVPLGAGQLDATVSVVGPAPAGALSYSPPAGTVLAPGAQRLSVTAAATTDYNAATASVSLTVLSQFLDLLDPKVSGALAVSGNAVVNVPGPVAIDSSSATALTAGGSAQVQGTSIQVVGGFQQTGKAAISPAPTTGVAPFADPLAMLAGPSTAGLSNYGSVSITGGGTTTLLPGIYKSIKIAGSGSVTLKPGLYLIEGGGLTVGGSASVSGSGVTIYNTFSNYPLATGSTGGITLGGSGVIQVSAAPTSAAAVNGAYPGVVIYQGRANTRALSLGGNAGVGLSGTVYAPNAPLVVSGNGTLNAGLVVDQLTVSGNVNLTQTATGSDGTGDLLGTSASLLAGDLYVYVNDPTGLFTAAEQARIQDAINAVDGLLVPYNVQITEVTDPTLANVVIDTGTTSACGGAAAGVLGCYNGANSEITILQGWNWYDGADPTQIGAGQYDFQTVVTHELGHALGLGGSSDPNSPMNETLAAGVVRRTMTVADLNIAEAPSGADPERAAPVEPTPSGREPAGAAAVAAPVLDFTWAGRVAAGEPEVDGRVFEPAAAVPTGPSQAAALAAVLADGRWTREAEPVHDPLGPEQAVRGQGTAVLDELWSAGRDLGDLDRCFAAWPAGREGGGRADGSHSGRLRFAELAAPDRREGPATVVAAQRAGVVVAAADRVGHTQATVGPAAEGVIPHGTDLWFAGLAAAVVGAWAPTAGSPAADEDPKTGGNRGRKRR